MNKFSIIYDDDRKSLNIFGKFAHKDTNKIVLVVDEKSFQFHDESEDDAFWNSENYTLVFGPEAEYIFTTNDMVLSETFEGIAILVFNK